MLKLESVKVDKLTMIVTVYDDCKKLYASAAISERTAGRQFMQQEGPLKQLLEDLLLGINGLDLMVAAGVTELPEPEPVVDIPRPSKVPSLSTRPSRMPPKGAA